VTLFRAPAAHCRHTDIERQEPAAERSDVRAVLVRRAFVLDVIEEGAGLVGVVFGVGPDHDYAVVVGDEAERFGCTG